MLTIKDLLGLSGSLALVAAAVEGARATGDSVPLVLVVVGTAIALTFLGRGERLS